MIKKPLLAAEADLSALVFPILASAKLDGIRALVIDGVVMSRRFKPIPNLFVQKKFGRPEFEGYDGELIVGPPGAKDCYRRTMSGCMSMDGCPDVELHAFDSILEPHRPYNERIVMVQEKHRVEQVSCGSLSDVLECEEYFLEQGYEGLMLRAPQGKYKEGRSTVREGILMKLKRFSDAEFEVVGYEERMHNGNEGVRDAVGRLKRSSHQENMSGRGDLGALIVKGADGQISRVGSGFTDDERRQLWENPDAMMGRIAKIKYFAVGVKDLPRHPVFLGWFDAS